MGKFDTSKSADRFCQPSKPKGMFAPVKEAHSGGNEGTTPETPGKKQIGDKVRRRTSHEMAKRFS